ncbi:hypothetical protein BCR44DRAFT_1426955 [Catenaria anguillulae PL171]|uniref:Uncharacterized protein n=1 Tax=Catenaria anguillulae PL171 TaxID=765915 RepID=A0A1Y2I2M1_9FUNG|nr:hypothetical protein BCR44DRAFT_1426955 [Catenaria anguillulae PL171]
MDVYAQLARNKSKQHQRPTNLTLGSSQSNLLSHPNPQPQPQPIVRHSTGLSPPPIPSILGSPPPPSPPLPPQQPSLPTRFLRSLSSSILPTTTSSSSSTDHSAHAHDLMMHALHTARAARRARLPPRTIAASVVTSFAPMLGVSGPPRRRLAVSEHAGHLVRVCKVCYRAADRDRSDPRALRREVERLRTHKLMLERERSARLEQSMQQATGPSASAGGELTSAGPALATLAVAAAPGGVQLTSTSQPMAAPARPQQPGEADKDKDGIGMLGSVPSDWNWSTF